MAWEIYFFSFHGRIDPNIFLYLWFCFMYLFLYRYTPFVLSHETVCFLISIGEYANTNRDCFKHRWIYNNAHFKRNAKPQVNQVLLTLHFFKWICLWFFVKALLLVMFLIVGYCLWFISHSPFGVSVYDLTSSSIVVTCNLKSDPKISFTWYFEKKLDQPVSKAEITFMQIPQTHTPSGHFLKE